jgi:hypothetical protein
MRFTAVDRENGEKNSAGKRAILEVLARRWHMDSLRKLFESKQLTDCRIYSN